jgi:hypothetical protein
MIYSNKICFGMSNSISNLKEGQSDGGWGKANKFSLKDPDTDRSSTLQKSFSNQNSRQRSLASNSSNNVYRKRPFSGLHKKNSPFQGYTNISKVTKLVVNSQLLKLFCKVLERSVSGSFRENLFQFWLLIPGFVCFTDFDFFPYF